MSEQTTIGEAKTVSTEELENEFVEPIKPVFEKPTKATIKDISLKTSGQMAKNKKGEPYEKAYVSVVLTLDEPTTEDITEATSNLSVSIYKQGDKKILYWGTEKSDAGKFQRMVCKAFQLDTTSGVTEIFATAKGQKVVIQSEERQNPSDKSIVKKPIIQSFQI